MAKLKSNFKMNLGEVSVFLNKEELILKPTYQAASRISNQFNGFRDARQALVAENFDAVVFILRIGLNISGAEARELPERVYKNGITAELLIPMIEYIGILANGGRPVLDIEGDNKEEEDLDGKNA
jgi:hypothetical protein